MIYFDATKSGSAGHRSGLMRVSARLRAELGAAAAEVKWSDGLRDRAGKEIVGLRAEDWFLTSELFSDRERPGFSDFIERHPCRLAAIFHDAIPLKHPHITWPQSVARHPGYMKSLARFDRVWAVSEASRQELLGFWRWQGVERVPPVEVLTLGADFAAAARVTEAPIARSRHFLCVGIVEPRKNQVLLVNACEELWREGLAFELNVVGRVNPHFGGPIVARMKQVQREFPALQFHESADDGELAALYAGARASVFPTIAEGCGLPLLESLWLGVPCVCSDLPVLRENAPGGGCVAVTVNDRAAWKAALRRMIVDDAWHAKLAQEAIARPLPTWADAARVIERALR
jgi:glycosyltransferase involved in cell wall biosynthesis